MTDEIRQEVMELAKKVATENPPKSGIEKYLDKRAKREEAEARANEQLLNYYGLKK